MALAGTLTLFYAAAIIAVIGFQIALIAGAPLGRITQGGSHEGALPAKGRAIAAVSILILLAMGLAVLSAAGFWPNWPRWTGWAALAMQTLSMILNWITPSEPERRLWGPITSALALLALSAMLTSG